MTCTTSKTMVLQGGAVLRANLHHHHPHIMGWCGVAAQRCRPVVVQWSNRKPSSKSSVQKVFEQ